MNIENNERYKETEDKIVKAYGRLSFSKKNGKVTVSDVCKEANIHRTTFYGHFADIFALESYVSGLEFRRLLQEFVTEEGWNLREGILFELRFFYTHQPLAKRLFLSEASEDRIDRLYSDIVKSDLSKSYCNKFHIENETEMTYHQSFLNAGFTAILKKWALSGFRETPEVIADYICKILMSM